MMNNKVSIPINPTYHEIVNSKAKEWESKRSDRYREYRRKWVENPKEFILEDAPLHIDIELTNACNLKCPMCPRTVMLEDRSHNNLVEIGNMDFSTYKKIVEEAAQIGVYSIKLNWLGEPLLHKNIIEMIEYAKSKGIVDVMFNTNATLLTEKMAVDLINSGLDKLFFSFDSPIKSSYEKIRIGANYDETLNNIRNFIKIREALGKDSPLTRVSMVRMVENENEYQQFVDLFTGIVDIVAYLEHREFRSTINNKKDRDNNKSNFACSQLWQRMVISWNGDVVACCLDCEKEYIVGNIHEDSVINIWKNNRFMRIRELHQQNQWDKIHICKKCSTPNQKEDGSV